MEDTMGRLWRGFGALPGYREAAEDWNIAIDVIQKPEEVIVKAAVPGVKPEDIDVTVEDNVLTIKAEKKTEVEDESSRYLVREQTWGSYYRALRLPDMVDANKIKSEYEHGVLTISMPKAEEKKRKQIKVNVRSRAGAIESGSKK
jgi:HSP20 family protein